MRRVERERVSAGVYTEQRWNPYQKEGAGLSKEDGDLIGKNVKKMQELQPSGGVGSPMEDAEKVKGLSEKENTGTKN